MRLFNRRPAATPALRSSSAGESVGTQTLAERAVAERVLRWYGDSHTPVFGAPSRCPDCGSYGMVDRIDDQHGRTDNSCFGCGASWTLTRRALENRPPRAPRHSLGAGILVRDLDRHACQLRPAGQVVAIG